MPLKGGCSSKTFEPDHHHHTERRWLSDSWTRTMPIIRGERIKWRMVPLSTALKFPWSVTGIVYPFARLSDIFDRHCCTNYVLSNYGCFSSIVYVCVFFSSPFLRRRSRFNSTFRLSRSIRKSRQIQRESLLSFSIPARFSKWLPFYFRAPKENGGMESSTVFYFK